jgi:DNA polymerase
MKNDKTGIIKELHKAMEFYSELGFEYLPVKKINIAKFLTEKSLFIKQDIDNSYQQAAEDPNSNSQGSEEALKRLRDEIGDCRRCKLSGGRKNIVFGEGNPDAKLMFIGEGPGGDEDIQARPFVGDAGKLLTKLIVKLGLKREEVYIANIVKCRPPYNRNPEEEEINTCRPFVEKQIEIINPLTIVCLGNVSAKALLRLNIPISKLRGNFSRYKDIPVMPTFHPAYLLRNPRDKWLTWEDMQKVLKKLKK